MNPNTIINSDTDLESGNFVDCALCLEGTPVMTETEFGDFICSNCAD